MDYLESIRRRVDTASVKEVPRPWVLVATIAIGGLTEVGFGEDSDLILVVSSQGLGVFDATTGVRVARDREPPTFDGLRAQGIGPLEGQTIRLAGLCGGGLATGGIDGWCTETITLSWPDQHLLLIAPDSSLYSASAKFTKLAVESEVRAFGFSDTGSVLVIATSSTLILYYYPLPPVRPETPASGRRSPRRPKPWCPFP